MACGSKSHRLLASSPGHCLIQENLLLLAMGTSGPVCSPCAGEGEFPQLCFALAATASDCSKAALEQNWGATLRVCELHRRAGAVRI